MDFASDTGFVAAALDKPLAERTISATRVVGGMSPNVKDLDLNVGLQDGDAVELDELTNRLREQLLELDVEAVDRVHSLVR